MSTVSSDRTRHLRQPTVVETRASRPHVGKERFTIVSRLPGETREVLRDRAVFGRLPADRLHDLVARIVAEQVGADAGHDEVLEAIGLLRRDREQDSGAHGEPDGVDRPVRHLFGDV